MSNNKNTAQQNGYKINPLNKVKEAWHRFRSGFDKRQRQKNFEAHLDLQERKFQHKQDQDRATNTYRDNTLHFKQEKALNDYNQKERQHADKMTIAAANTDIKRQNSNYFGTDVQGKNAQRNANITSQEQALHAGGYKGNLTRAELPEKSNTLDKVKEATDQVRKNISQKHEWQSIPKENNDSATSAIPKVSGINPKGTKGNRPKGIK